ncbi:WecB/TagA/CpsF family glycosyltransferase [Rhizobium sp. B230/85]|uniref:WecB/TagA/CpsF family glycosyltransferase n=1 Tax=unclassified Rhizobium TaxID=2613769 RepID=UPI001ADCB9FC|nr:MULTISPECIES: WecB/TagA/CpsF family glycosyltransferase [unclassified Rhizobium]MBO9136789.1 WecB/TagA/CpsF family glycosyltransferase [Rhizobium sp. B209b/85]QXZ99063.1 WecB/TagA/CpsF family glycosyltransferase [Rhizobium sp. B230/85]
MLGTGDYSSVKAMGLTLHKITMRELVQACVSKKRLGMVVTPNAHFFVRAEKDPKTKQLYNSADLSVCDSRVIKRLLFLANVHVPLVAGSDLTAQILTNPAAQDLRICLIGGHASYQEKLMRQFSLRHIRQFEFPWKKSFSDEDIERACSAIAGDYHLTLVCLGAPLQERVAALLRRSYGARFPTILCVGASVDFLVGAQKRSPAFLRVLGFEWAYRFSTSPGRFFKRYVLECPAIFVIYTRWLLVERFRMALQ